ncbi:hypothetical protein F5Y15DRAFT_256439 [Xylariaceae sp. FL0016]|nr:hypothetical protein F5Y15DRAFT_256439 [Xylariaceae sp. FL0016]
MEYSHFHLPVKAARDPLPSNIKMSALTMPTPHYHHPGFNREFAWLDTRPEPSHRQRNDQEKVALPSIRQAFPELQLQAQQDGVVRTPSTTTSPTSGPFSGTMTPPEYVHSPNQHKRRRLSFDEDREAERVSQVPRLYADSQRALPGQQSPPTGARLASEVRGMPGRTSPYIAKGALPSMRSSATVETHERVEARPTLPSLPLLNFDRGAADMHRIRSHSGDGYVHEPTRRPSLAPSSSHSMEALSPGYRHPNYAYTYHHPSRVQSLSVGSVHPFDRTPLAPGAYGHQFHDSFMRIGEFGMGMNGDNKQRKRRGNLPKETTDKLRAWFIAHLQHPYPTEDEKQELMRQTRLQMNQISNWFINARRRHLPNFIKDARTESDATSVRGVGRKVLPSTERIEYDPEGKQLSDGETSNYDDVDYEAMNRHRSVTMKRGSI